MRERAAAHHQELERVVDAGRVALVLVDDGEELGDVVAEELRLQAALARAHPVHVALERVDLAVVADVAVGVRERPRRERVRAEARVDHRQRADDAGIGQVRVILSDLIRQQQALVDDGVHGHAGHVEVLPPLDGRLADGVLDALADDVELALELRLIEAVAGDEDLPDGRLRPARLRADRAALDGHVAPAQQPRAFLRDHLLEEPLAWLALRGVRREEDRADPVLAGVRQLHADVGACALEELVRHLEQDARPVARAGVAALGAAVKEVVEDLECLADDVVRLDALDVGDEADPATVLFKSRIVETLFRWKPGDVHLTAHGRNSFDRQAVTNHRILLEGARACQANRRGLALGSPAKSRDCTGRSKEASDWSIWTTEEDSRVNGCG